MHDVVGRFGSHGTYNVRLTDFVVLSDPKRPTSAAAQQILLRRTFEVRRALISGRTVFEPPTETSPGQAGRPNFKRSENSPKGNHFFERNFIVEKCNVAIEAFSFEKHAL